VNYGANVLPSFSLAGRVAVVTGGSRGIGRSIAQGLAESGADVVIASRKLESCERAAREIAASTGRAALGVTCHVGDWDQCDALVNRVYEQFDRCDVLVNNAGVSPLYGDLVDITEGYYDKVQSVNLKGPFRLAVLVGSRMAAGAGGSIINVSSVGSIRPSKSEAVYDCAKAGLNAMTVAIADAYGPSVRANCIMPGPVLTDISAAWPDEAKERIAAGVPLRRIGQPDDYVGAAVWLAGDASAYVTGAFIRVDGGLSRQPF
jgi:NAD(P)-dependent dehydrogenase (short-subunit alcohol dehydrogenase family)